MEESSMSKQRNSFWGVDSCATSTRSATCPQVEGVAASATCILLSTKYSPDSPASDKKDGEPSAGPKFYFKAGPKKITAPIKFQLKGDTGEEEVSVHCGGGGGATEVDASGRKWAIQKEASESAQNFLSSKFLPLPY